MLRGKRAVETLRCGLQFLGCVVQVLDAIKMKIDTSYQRPLTRSTVNKIKQRFNPAALGVFQIGRRRNGDLYVIDAQHRWTAICELFKEGKIASASVLCIVHQDTTPQIESAIYLDGNDNKPVKGNNKFKAALVRRSELELAINQTAVDEGFSLDFRTPGEVSDDLSARGAIHAVSYLIPAYNKCKDHLQLAFRFLVDTYGGRKRNAKLVPTDVCHGQVIFGIALFLAACPCKDTVVMARRFKALGLDMTAAWYRIKKTSGSGYSRPQQLAKWLYDAIGNCWLGATG